MKAIKTQEQASEVIDIFLENHGGVIAWCDTLEFLQARMGLEGERVPLSLIQEHFARYEAEMKKENPSAQLPYARG